LEQRILIGGPLIEDINGAVLKIAGEESQSLPLTLRQIDRRESTILNAKLVVQLKPAQVFLRPGVRREVNSKQTVKNVEIREDRGEMLAVFVSAIRAYRLSIEPDLAGFGPVKPG